MKNIDLYDNYVEDNGDYAIGMTGYSCIVEGVPLYHLVLVLVSHEDMLLSVAQTSKIEDLNIIRNIQGTIQYSDFKQLDINNVQSQFDKISPDFSLTYSMGNLKINYPKNFEIVDVKKNDNIQSFRLQKHNTTDENICMAMVQFATGNFSSSLRNNDECLRRLRAFTEHQKTTPQYSNYVMYEPYVENRGTYSVGIIGSSFIANNNGITIYCCAVLTYYSDVIILSIAFGSNFDDLAQLLQITGTLRLQDYHNFRVGNMTTNYSGLKDWQKQSKTITNTPEVAVTTKPISKENKQVLSPSNRSQVDLNIPKGSISNEQTFAIIIGNENYQNEESVPFAKNDGEVFYQYCQTTLGIPARNIHYHPNATLNNIQQEVNWLNQVCEVYEGEASIILYYAGHGFLDESNKTSYLLPVDGDSKDYSSGYKLNDLYSTLGAMPSKQITIFVDANFSGSKRDGSMLSSARGVALKAKPGAPQGNMVVFYAAKEDETAFSYKEEGHGLFTYFLLKKLQETRGSVTLLELSDFITTNVLQKSIVTRGNGQTPQVIVSSQVGDNWKEWKL